MKRLTICSYISYPENIILKEQHKRFDSNKGEHFLNYLKICVEVVRKIVHELCLWQDISSKPTRQTLVGV